MRRLLLQLGLPALGLIQPGCQSPSPKSSPAPAQGTTAPKTFTALTAKLGERLPDAHRLAAPGPFLAHHQRNLTFRLPPVRRGQASREILVADAVFTSARGRPPLVLIQHGNHSRKEAHLGQAQRLATWGVHSLVVQQRNTKNWVANGRRLARLVRTLAATPKLLTEPFDRQAIILAGHSFGGSAVTVAAGARAPVAGLVLLDPALVSEKVQASMQRVQVPVMVLGADRQIFRSRRRDRFFRHLRGQVSELSVKGATHDDAQFPSMFSLYAFGFDPFTDRGKQEHFRTALTAAVISLAATGELEYAWQALQTYVERGILVEGRRRRAKAPVLKR